MAQSSNTHVVASLRAITYRISSTPTKQLPAVAAQIAGSIWNCRDILSLDPQYSKSSNEAAGIVHRFKTTLTSLLQDRTVEGRWAAVVLTKAAIEAGGVATLSKSNGWVKSLTAIMKKPDPPTTRQLAVITLTRIFMLTWDHQILVREITTPALPAFISTCLSNVERDRCSPGELDAVLEAFGTLISRHPTLVRSHETQIRTMCTRIWSASIAPPETGLHFSQRQQESGGRLLVLLHQCAPKQGAGEAWENLWGSAIIVAHATCNLLFRSIIEDSHSEILAARPTPRVSTVPGNVGVTKEAASGLQGWQECLAGSKSLRTHIASLKAHLEIATPDNVNIQIGLLIELIARILNLTLDIQVDSLRHNHQIPKDEREALFCVLPEIHVATLDLIISLLQRFEMASAPFILVLEELALGVFKAEHSNTSIRTASYTTLNHILRISGPSMSKSDVAELGTVITACCHDLLHNDNDARDTKVSEAMPYMNSTNTTDSKRAFHTPQFPYLIDAANTLLTTLGTKINPFAMPSKLRVQIERTAILARNKDALVALVLNPAAKGSRRTLETSLLPILAREYPKEPEVEALLRPRMPPIVRRQGGENDDADVNGLEEEDLMEATLHINGGDGTDPFEVERPSAAQQDGLRMGDSEDLAGQDDDLYSLTPPRKVSNEYEDQGATGHTTIDGLSSVKRSAEVEIAETIPPVKRARMSPTINPAMDMTDTTGVVLSERQTQNPVESAHPAIGQSGSQHVPQNPPAVPSIDHTTTAPGIGATVALQGDVASDDSDFEMPPLTMEPDTDPDDDEDEE